MFRYSLSRKTVDFLRFRSIFGSWRGGGVLFCVCFRSDCLVEKRKPDIPQNCDTSGFSRFFRVRISICTAVSAFLEMSCCFGKGFISELQAVPRETSPTAFCSYSSSLRLRTPDAFTAPNPNAMYSAAPTHRSQFVISLFPVWGRLTSALEESVPVPVFGSTV